MLPWVAVFFLASISFDRVYAFDSNPPERCAEFGELQSISVTDWENGLGGWTADTHDIASPSDFDTPDWAVVGSLPDSRSGQAAFVANLDTGDCVTDFKIGALTLNSPLLEIPGGVAVPRISINHWFDIEHQWDGGNFKISVNGGVFNLIPVTAIEVGPYNDTLFAALTEEGGELNLNPLAGQDGFTGPDYPTELPRWGQSHINLTGIAAAGDSIQLQFDYGVDECGGNVGWYVDEVEFYGCSGEVQPSDTILTLVKKVVNNNGGEETPSAWTLSASGPDSFDGNGPSVSSGAGLAAGTYNLSESGPPGYDASAWDCDFGTQTDADTIIVATGQAVTCTITNDDISPTLTVQKTIINDNGGTVTDKNAFGLKVDGGVVLHNATNSFDAGNHTVSEDGLAGYQPGIWGGDCEANGSITLAPGQDAICTITNDDISPTLKLVKTVINDHGGEITDPDAFGLKVDGDGVLHNVSNAFDAGIHTASEDGSPDYKAGKWGGDCNPDGSVTLSLGQTATCTITNDDINLLEIIFRDGFEQ